MSISLIICMNTCGKKFCLISIEGYIIYFVIELKQFKTNSCTSQRQMNIFNYQLHGVKKHEGLLTGQTICGRGGQWWQMRYNVVYIHHRTPLYNVVQFCTV